jgi:hypothetical protein
MGKLLVLFALFVLCFGVKTTDAQERQNLNLFVKAELKNEAKLKEYEKFNSKIDIFFSETIVLDKPKGF